MATTTNYAWTTPDNSGLVKNGAQDIRTLGSSVDTSLWNVGYGQAGKNKLINGNFDIWQRGTSSTSNGAYNSADRWWMYYGAGTSTFSRESTIVPSGSTYSLKIAQSVATNTNLQILQSIESLNAISLAGRTLTISGQFAASASTTLGIDVVYSTATDVAPSGSWTAATIVTAGTGTVSTTASFTKITGVYTIPSTAKSVMARVTSSSVTSGTSVYVSQIQLEVGSVATAFQTATGTIAGELAACQRYYIRYSSNGDSNFDLIGPFGSAAQTTQVFIPWNTPTMRTAASAVDYANLRLSDNSGGTPAISNLVLIVNSNPTTQWIEVTTTGATAYRPYTLQANNNATAYIGFSAEL